jgi:hypothetical protein
MILFIDTLYSYIHKVWDYRWHSAIAILHTFQFMVTHVVGFSVFTCRILATDLSQSLCNFKSHMESSFHSLIPFLPLFCSCQIRILDSSLYYCSMLLYAAQHFARTTQKTASLVKEACLLIRCLAMDVLLLLALAPAGMCLRSRCLAVGLSVTMCKSF